MKNSASIDSQKQIIRDTLIAARRNISSENREKANRIITEKLFIQPVWKSAQTICVYISLADEVDTRPLVQKLLKEKKSVIVPKVSSGDNLTLHMIELMSDLVPGVFGILEPEKSCPLVGANTIDLFIIPGVAFDRKGHRLGRGKGHYDRLLENISVPRIALAYAIQVIAEVPCSSYDVSVSTILTEKEIIKVKS